MEEKERYKLESHNGTFCEFHDTETDEWYIRKDLVTDLLNQQDKDIKKLRQENQRLKQQLHDLPNKIVEETRDNMSKRIMEKQIKWGDNIQIGFTYNAINEYLDTILTKYNGE